MNQKQKELLDKYRKAKIKYADNPDALERLKPMFKAKFQELATEPTIQDDSNRPEGFTDEYPQPKTAEDLAFEKQFYENPPDNINPLGGIVETSRSLLTTPFTGVGAVADVVGSRIPSWMPVLGREEGTTPISFEESYNNDPRIQRGMIGQFGQDVLRSEELPLSLMTLGAGGAALSGTKLLGAAQKLPKALQLGLLGAGEGVGSGTGARVLRGEDISAGDVAKDVLTGTGAGMFPLAWSPLKKAAKTIYQTGTEGIGQVLGQVAPKVGGAFREVTGTQGKFTKRIGDIYKKPEPKDLSFVETGKELGIDFDNDEFTGALLGGVDSPLHRMEQTIAQSSYGGKTRGKYNEALKKLNKGIDDVSNLKASKTPATAGAKLSDNVNTAKNKMFKEADVTYNSIVENKDYADLINDQLLEGNYLDDLQGSINTYIGDLDAKINESVVGKYKSGLQGAKNVAIDIRDKLEDAISFDDKIADIDALKQIELEKIQLANTEKLQGWTQGSDDLRQAAEKKLSASNSKIKKLEQQKKQLEESKNKNIISTLNSVRSDLGKVSSTGKMTQSQLELTPFEMKVIKDMETAVRSTIYDVVEGTMPNVASKLKKSNQKMSKFFNQQDLIKDFVGKEKLGDEQIFSKAFSNTKNASTVKQMFYDNGLEKEWKDLAMSWLNNKVLKRKDGKISIAASLSNLTDARNADMLGMVFDSPNVVNKLVEYLRFGNNIGLAKMTSIGDNTIQQGLKEWFGITGTKAKLGAAKIAEKGIKRSPTSSALFRMLGREGSKDLFFDDTYQAPRDATANNTIFGK